MVFLNLRKIIDTTLPNSNRKKAHETENRISVPIQQKPHGCLIEIILP